MSLGERIKEAREQHLSLTQKELGYKLGIDSVSVSRWERNVVEPRPRHIRELARLTDLPVSWFFYEDEVPA